MEVRKRPRSSRTSLRSSREWASGIDVVTALKNAQENLSSSELLVAIQLSVEAWSVPNPIGFSLDASFALTAQRWSDALLEASLTAWGIRGRRCARLLVCCSPIRLRSRHGGHIAVTWRHDGYGPYQLANPTDADTVRDPGSHWRPSQARYSNRPSTMQEWRLRRGLQHPNAKIQIIVPH